MQLCDEACGDPALPFLTRALDRNAACSALAPLLGRPDELRLNTLRVIRYKPGRRCLVAYDFSRENDPTPIRIVGKLRARGPDRRAFAINRALWRAGFRPDNDRPFSVPEPLGIVREFHMIVQRWVPGETAENAFDGARGLVTAPRIAKALHALHQARVATDRTHDIEAELRLLRDRLDRVCATRPQWAQRIQRVAERCEEQVEKLRGNRPCGIHRDFYPAQVILGPQQLAMLDLDLYAHGDPALDVGNFSAHLTERSIRLHGSARAYESSESCLERTYLALASDVSARSIRIYAALTLARHLYISTTFPDRAHTTPLLLACVEERLDAIRS